MSKIYLPLLRDEMLPALEFHYFLEPGEKMMQWEGWVLVLGTTQAEWLPVEPWSCYSAPWEVRHVHGSPLVCVRSPSASPWWCVLPASPPWKSFMQNWLHVSQTHGWLSRPAVMGRRLTLTINYIRNWRTLNRCHQAIIARWLPPTSASRPARVLPGIQIICRMVPTSMLICISGLSSENRLFPELATSLWLCDVLSALTALPGITQLVKPSAAFKTQLGHCLSWEAFTPSSTR